MKELDFDELDKAVNSLVSQAKPKGASTPATPTEPKAAKQDTEAKSQTVPVTVSPGRHTSRLGVQSAKPQLSKGSFIDVMTVKPKAKPVSSSPVKASRQGVTIQPPKGGSLKTPVEVKRGSEALELEQKSPADVLSEEPKKEEEKLQLPAEKEQEPLKERAAGSYEKWPDPLDFHTNGSEVSEVAKKEEPISPFLPDTKVEKRPLGAFAASQPATIDEDKKSSEESKKSPEAAKSLVAAVPEPVVSVEEPKETKTTEKDSEASVADTTETVEKQVRESALLSIPQQYKRTTQETNEATRPVFDTKEYHQPLLEATTHGHHGLWRVLLILVFVVLLATVAYWAFAYFM